MSLETDTELAEMIIETPKKTDLWQSGLKGAGNQYEDRAQLDHGGHGAALFYRDMKFRIVCLWHTDLFPPRELYRFGMAIEKSVQETGRSAVMIASGDLSHHLTDDGPYHYSPFGPKFDKRITEIISLGY